MKREPSRVINKLSLIASYNGPSKSVVHIALFLSQVLLSTLLLKARGLDIHHIVLPPQYPLSNVSSILKKTPLQYPPPKMALAAFVLLAIAQLAMAHFGVEYPIWRDNTLGSSADSNYSQWEYPCKSSFPSPYLPLGLTKKKYRCRCTRKSGQPNRLAIDRRQSGARLAPQVDVHFCEPRPWR